MISFKQGGTLLLLALLSLPSPVPAAPAPFDIDLKELDRQEPAAPPKSAKKQVQKAKKPRVAAAAAVKARRESAAASDAASDASSQVRYTVRPGDHIFKILMVRFGMSNEAAERLIPEVVSLNNISDIKRLKVGRTLLIPGRGHHERSARSAKKGRYQRRREAAQAALPPDGSAQLAAQDAAGSPEAAAPGSPAAPATEREALAPARVEPLPVIPAPAASSPLAAPPVTAASREISAAPAIPPANTWICSVTERDSAKIVDAVMNALSVSWSRNRIIHSDEGAANTFSIRVDRYFEYKGARYIVSIGESDPYSYTLIRLLEGAGYKVLRISGGENFKTVNEKLLRLIGLAPDFGRHALQEGRETTGFLLQQDDAGGRRVVITGEPVDPRQKWVMTSGCGAR